MAADPFPQPLSGKTTMTPSRFLLTALLLVSGALAQQYQISQSSNTSSFGANCHGQTFTPNVGIVPNPGAVQAVDLIKIRLTRGSLGANAPSAATYLNIYDGDPNGAGTFIGSSTNTVNTTGTIVQIFDWSFDQLSLDYTTEYWAIMSTTDVAGNLDVQVSLRSVANNSYSGGAGIQNGLVKQPGSQDLQFQINLVAAAAAPIANYPLLTDLADATGNFGSTTLSGAPLPAQPANGVCLTLSQELRTPNLWTLDPTDFQIDVEFDLAGFPQSRAPVIIGGDSTRWIAISVRNDGTLGIKYNNSNQSWSSTVLSLGTWYAVSLRYESGTVQLVLDGTLVHEAVIGSLNPGGDFDFWTRDYALSADTRHNGCIRNLAFYNDTTLLGPLAQYPLLTDLADATGNNGNATLSGSPQPAPPANGVCLNLSQELRTPNLLTLDPTDFQIDVEFDLAGFPDPFLSFLAPIIIGGSGSRWIAIVVRRDGTLGVKYNNSNQSWSSTVLSLGTWYAASLRYESGTVQLVLDGTLVHEAVIGPLNPGGDFSFWTRDYSLDSGHNGCIRNLAFYNDTTLVSPTLARNRILGAGCYRSFTTFYQEFQTASAFDLSGTSLTLSNNGGGFDVTAAGSLNPVGSLSTPTTLPSNLSVAVGTLGLTVHRYGFVSFGPGNGNDRIPDIGTLLNDPATSVRVWHNFNPLAAGSGQIKYEEAGTRAQITWDGVFDFGHTVPNTFQFQIDTASGDIVIAFGSMSGLGNSYLVGYSPGGPNLDPGSVDLSTSLPIVAAAADYDGLLLTADTYPILGTSWNHTISNIPTGGIALSIIGLSDPNIADLSFIGMPDCGLRASLDQVDVVPGGPTASVQFQLPNNPALVGAQLFMNAAALAVGVNAFGAITSNGVRGDIGPN
jgi:hypothetical protein